MTRNDYDDLGDLDRHDRGGDFDDDTRDENAGLVTEAEVICPWCGEAVVIAVDPGGGSFQEYDEDCQICCRPWRLSIHFDRDGTPTVEVDRAS